MRKTSLAFLFTILTATAGYASAASNTNPQSSADLFSAAKDGDTAKVRSLLSRVSTITGFDRYDLIKAALEAKCNTEIVKSVLDKKSDSFEPKLEEKYGYLENLRDGGRGHPSRGPIEKPGASLVSIAAKNFCPDALKLISEKTSAEDFALGAYQRPTKKMGTLETTTDSPIEEIANAAKKEGANDAEETPRIVATGKFIKTRVEADCVKVGGESCKAKAEFDKMTSEMAADVKQKEYEDSPAGIHDQACSAQAELQEHEAILNREKEIARTSGSANVVTLHKAGSRIVDLKNDLNEYRRLYKERAKKSLNLNDCK